MAATLCDATVTRACIAAAGRLRGVRARRLEPEQVVRALLGGAGPIVGVEEPAASPVAGAVVAPTLVTFSSPPPLELREAAWEKWPEVIRRQSSWADYVFTKQPLFDPARPVVLAAPGGDGDDAYLDHAASLGTGAPFVCLRGDAASFAAASGGTVVGDAAPGPEAAHAAAGAACDALNLHGDFAQLLGPRGGRASSTARRGSSSAARDASRSARRVSKTASSAAPKPSSASARLSQSLTKTKGAPRPKPAPPSRQNRAGSSQPLALSPPSVA